MSFCLSSELLLLVKSLMNSSRLGENLSPYGYPHNGKKNKVALIHCNHTKTKCKQR